MNNTLNKLSSKAKKCVSSNNLTGALECYKKICAIDTNNDQAWMALGSIAGNLSKFDIAETAFRKAHLLQNKSGPASLNLAQIHELRGDFDNAIKLYIEHYNKNGGNNEIKLKIAVAYGRMHNYIESVKWLSDYISINENNSYAYYCLASAHQALNNTTEAFKNYSKAIELSPNSFQIYSDYAALLQKEGDFEFALSLYKKSIELNNKHFTSQYNIATLYHILDQLDNAVTHFNNAIALDPNSADALVGLGKSFHYIGLSSKSISLYEKAIRLNPRCCDAYANLGISHINNSNFDEAMNCYRKALEIEPANIEITCAIAKLYERKSEYEESRKILGPLISSQSVNYSIALAYGKLSRNIDDRENAIRILDKACSHATTPPASKSTIQFLIGKLYDDLESYDNAFEHFDLANKLLGMEYDISNDISSLNDILTIYSDESIKQIPTSNNKDSTPIFIVGMPRSGTTLTEQILASHPDVHGAGELSYISDLANNLHQRTTGEIYPFCMKDITPDILYEASNDYINLIRRSNIRESHVTDKMPHNFMLLGFIEKLFPNATIIHCTRSPIDTCLSIYFSNFNQRHPYSSNFTHLADYYEKYYLKLMDHWKKVLTIPMFEVNYESLIDDQNSITKSLLDHCKLEWHDNCLRFYESGRNVDTISYDQVRKPLYTKSRNRWKNYEKHINPLLDKFN